MTTYELFNLCSHPPYHSSEFDHMGHRYYAGCYDFCSQLTAERDVLTRETLFSHPKHGTIYRSVEPSLLELLERVEMIQMFS
jgi:hypothetical protein